MATIEGYLSFCVQVGATSVFRPCYGSLSQHKWNLRDAFIFLQYNFCIPKQQLSNHRRQHTQCPKKFTKWIKQLEHMLIVALQHNFRTKTIQSMKNARSHSCITQNQGHKSIDTLSALNAKIRISPVLMAANSRPKSQSIKKSSTATTSKGERYAAST